MGENKETPKQAPDGTLDFRVEDIVEIESWEEMEDDPLFIWDIDKDKLKVGKPVGHYKLMPPKSCRLTSCHSGHNEGWYVQFSNGKRSYIGVDCGRDAYPVLADWSRAYRRYTTRKAAQNRVNHCLTQITELEAATQELVNDRARVVYRLMKPFLNCDVVPNALVSALRTRLRTNNRAVVVERRRNERDQEIFKEANPNARGRELTHEQFAVGRLAGLESLETQRFKELIDETQAARKALDALDLENDPITRISIAAKKAEALPSLLQDAENTVAAFPRFVAESNLTLLHLLLPPGPDRDKVLRLAFDGEKGKWGKIGKTAALSRAAAAGPGTAV